MDARIGNCLPELINSTVFRVWTNAYVHEKLGPLEFSSTLCAIDEIVKPSVATSFLRVVSNS